jgi:hypothetical protein
VWSVSRKLDHLFNAVTILSTGHVGYAGTDGRVNIVGCMTADGVPAKIVDVTTFSVGSPVNSLAAAPDGALVVGCLAGVRVIDLDLPAAGEAHL